MQRTQRWCRCSKRVDASNYIFCQLPGLRSWTVFICGIKCTKWELCKKTGITEHACRMLSSFPDLNPDSAQSLVLDQVLDSCASPKSQAQTWCFNYYESEEAPATSPVQPERENDDLPPSYSTLELRVPHFTAERVIIRQPETF